jgi:hypothetical protein
VRIGPTGTSVDRVGGSGSIAEAANITGSRMGGTVVETSEGTLVSNPANSGSPFKSLQALPAGKPITVHEDLGSKPVGYLRSVSPDSNQWLAVGDDTVLLLNRDDSKISLLSLNVQRIGHADSLFPIGDMRG